MMNSSLALKVSILTLGIALITFAKPKPAAADTGYLRVSPSTCTVANGGDVRCWGIGIGDKPNEMGNALVQSLLSEPIKRIVHNNGWDTGGRFCALAESGTYVWCWEHGDPMEGATFSSPERSNLPDGFVAKAISMGSGHTCALGTTGEVRCWSPDPMSSAAEGQIGPLPECSTGQDADCLLRLQAGAITANNAIPLVLGEGRFATQVAAGGRFTCVLLDDGSVKCFGNNDYGQLGQGDQDQRGMLSGSYGDDLPPIDFGTDEDAVEIAAGESHACARFTAGKVRCWGLNSAGQLGIGTSEGLIGDEDTDVADFFQAVNFGTGVSAKSINASGQSTCAILSNDLLKCWGLNDQGQLGIGSLKNFGDQNNETPNKLGGIALGTNRKARSVDMYWNHICADLDNGQLKCWGFGRYGQLGIGSTKTMGDSAREMGDYLPVVNLGNQIPDNIVNPSIAGTLKVGSSVTAKAGTWSASPSAVYSYAWFTCTTTHPATDSVDASCIQLAGKTSPNLALKIALKGTYLLVRITATNIVGATVRVSRTYGPVR